jgi:DNA replication protein DnaC
MSRSRYGRYDVVDDDYTKDGLLYCGNCNTAKQIRIPLGENVHIMSCMCKCAEEAYNAERNMIAERERQNRIARYKQEAFQNKEMLYCTFDKDDNSDSELSRLCRNYSKKFTRDFKWLVLYGGTGVGKTFMAACIANSVMEKDFSVKFTTVSQFERKLWNCKNKYEVYAEYTGCGLLVIDDMGAERNSEYMNEILFNLIDERLKCQKPVVITTNLSQDFIANPEGVAMQRIMSRIYERSIIYLCKGQDRRKISMRETNRKAVEELLSYE